ncbi:hypothetical protein IAR50_005819 [Cryptococcus sp. DSM 104548]
MPADAPSYTPTAITLPLVLVNHSDLPHWLKDDVIVEGGKVRVRKASLAELEQLMEFARRVRSVDQYVPGLAVAADALYHALREKTTGNVHESDSRAAPNDAIQELVNSVRELGAKVDRAVTDLGAKVDRVERAAEETRRELKSDLADVKKELKKDVADVKKELADVKKELKKDVADVKKELKKDVADVKKELKKDVADVKKELADVKKELKKDVADVKKDVRKVGREVQEVRVEVQEVRELVENAQRVTDARSRNGYLAGARGVFSYLPVPNANGELLPPPLQASLVSRTTIAALSTAKADTILGHYGIPLPAGMNVDVAQKKTMILHHLTGRSDLGEF